MTQLILLIRTHDGLASNGLLYCPASATVDHLFFFSIFSIIERKPVIFCIV